MSRPVDPDLVARFVLRETTDAEHAEVKRLVAEDPAWADELRQQALLDVQLHEAFDALRAAPVALPGPSLLQRLRALLLPVVPVLAMAGAALWLLSTDPQGTYSLEVHGGESSLRSAPSAGHRYTRGSALDLVLRAEVPTATEPAVTLLLDGAPLPGAEVRYAKGGSILIRGVFGDTLPELEPGPHRLVVEVAGATHTLDLQWEAP
jgi:anti-sigma factor RsiW